MKKIIAVILLMCLSTLFACTGTPADTAQGDGTYPPTQESAADTESDGADSSTASAVPPVSDTVTADPVILLSTNIKDDTVLFAGICEKDSTISVKGTYTEEFTVTPDGGNFLFSVTLKERKAETLTVTAKVNEKNASGAITAEAKYKRGAEDREIFITYDSRICQNEILNDLYHTNLFTNKELLLMQRLAQARAADAKKSRRQRR